jgi:hypothetical protein
MLHFTTLHESLVIMLLCVIRLQIEETAFGYEEQLSVILINNFRHNVTTDFLYNFCLKHFLF